MGRQAQEIGDQILSLGMFSDRPGVEIAGELFDRLGHPEQQLRLIHIAGTNGKGSTAWFTAAILWQRGFRVGLCTSPHLARPTERIRVDGEEIPEADFARLGGCLLEEEAVMACRPTASDLLLAIGILYFRERSCDFAVIEAGLGGRLDSTTALTAHRLAEVCCITRIGLDHTAVLGGSLAQIAAEKAGIFRAGTKAVLARMDEEALFVLRKACRDLGIPYREVARQKKTEQMIAHMPPELSRTYQRENLANALTIVSMLGLGTEKEALLKEPSMERDTLLEVLSSQRELAGLSEIAHPFLSEGLQFPARLSLSSRYEGLLVDGAHNPQGAEALADSLRALFPGELFDAIIGIVKDKDAEGILRPMLPLTAEAVVVEVGTDSRRTDGVLLLGLLQDGGVAARMAADAKEAVSYFKEKGKGREGRHRMIAFGSLYLAGMLI